MVDFVFSETTATNNMHRFIFEGFGMVLGWGAVRAVTALRSGGLTLVTRAKRSDGDGDLGGRFNEALAKIVSDLEEKGANAEVQACDE